MNDDTSLSTLPFIDVWTRLICDWESPNRQRHHNNRLPVTAADTNASRSSFPVTIWLNSRIVSVPASHCMAWPLIFWAIQYLPSTPRPLPNLDAALTVSCGSLTRLDCTIWPPTPPALESGGRVVAPFRLHTQVLWFSSTRRWFRRSADGEPEGENYFLDVRRFAGHAQRPIASCRALQNFDARTRNTGSPHGSHLESRDQTFLLFESTISFVPKISLPQRAQRKALITSVG